MQMWMNPKAPDFYYQEAPARKGKQTEAAKD